MGNTGKSLEKLMTTEAAEIAKRVCQRKITCPINGQAISDDQVNEIKEVVEIVLEEARNHYEEKKRRPAPPPPEGGISIRGASKKYGVATSTICGWVDKGVIKVIKKTLNWTYLAEKDIAQIAQLHKEFPGRGRRSIIRKFTKQ